MHFGVSWLFLDSKCQCHYYSLPILDISFKQQMSPMVLSDVHKKEPLATWSSHENGSAGMQESAQT